MLVASFVITMVMLGQSNRVPKVTQSIRSEKKADSTVENAINRKSGILKESEGYLYNRIDLDLDGKQDVLVYVWGQDVCGSSGCTLFILKSIGGGSYEVVSELELVHPPVIVSQHRTKGWYDLVTSVYGGGVEPRYWVHQFDGRTYDGEVVGNVNPQEVQGIAYISDWGRSDAGVHLNAGPANGAER